MKTHRLYIATLLLVFLVPFSGETLETKNLRIAVSPFESSIGDEQQEYIGFQISEYLTSALATFPEITVIERGKLKEVIREQKLAISFDELSSAGLVHGGLCPRNLCWDGVQYWIIDWEPSLWQIRKGRTTLIYTHPFIAPSEIGTTSSLASLSDKVAFALTILKVSTQKEPSDDRIKEIENEVRCLSFKEIAADF